MHSALGPAARHSLRGMVAVTTAAAEASLTTLALPLAAAATLWLVHAGETQCGLQRIGLAATSLSLTLFVALRLVAELALSLTLALTISLGIAATLAAARLGLVWKGPP